MDDDFPPAAAVIDAFRRAQRGEVREKFAGPSMDDLSPAEMLIECAALLEVFAENADERDDGAEWAMASVMAKHARNVAKKASAP